jgi:hypothetical protein
MSEEKTLNQFYNIFKGNTSFYVKHQAPFKEVEGKLKASWCGFAVYNKRNPPPEGAEIGDLMPVTKELYREHLNGGDGLAIAPLTNTEDKRNICFYAVIDIDVYGVNFTWLVKRLYDAGFKFAAFLSKSGGLHIYFFFMDPEPGDKVIEALNKIVEVYGLSRLFVNEKNKSKVEVFPKQAVFVPGDKNVNCLMLPFYNSANKSKQKMLTAEGKLIAIEKALPIIDSMFTSVKELNQVLTALPYSDAPYCIQMLLLNGALAENDGRNNFLFSASIYLKKKYKENFKDALEEMNNCFEAPVGQEELDDIYTSVTDKGYDNYSCKRSPCADYCDKKLCALREYGVGKARNNRFTGADCWGELSKFVAGDGKDPYYKWQVRVNPDDEFKEVTVDSVDDLYNQTVIIRCCGRDLNWAPFRVKDNDWISTVNKAMEGIEQRTEIVSSATDTTSYSALRSYFLDFLANRQVRKTQPYAVGLRQVYYADKVYYFTTDGFKKYLDVQRFPIRGINLRDRLESYGCKEGQLEYKTSSGRQMKIHCWTKDDDEDLEERSDFYGSVYEGDADIINQVKNKEHEEEQKKTVDDAGVKF